MNVSDLSIIRLFNQQIADPWFKTPKELVNWMGAIQAQDFLMAKWALGLRLSGITDLDIETALNKGHILRTHVLRPTWHIIAPENIDWMLDLSASRIKAIMRTNDKKLGLNDVVYLKTNNIIEGALQGKRHLTRDELKAIFAQQGIATDENRLSHILVRAELDKITCSGKMNGNQKTIALLDERVPQRLKLTHEEALARLAELYFNSHAPATVDDFCWWSGLSITEARAALELVKDKLIPEQLEGHTYWFAGNIVVPTLKVPHVYLLPAFDEFLISYKDRTASLSLNNHKNTISQNGIFRPVVIVNGQVVGIWSRTIKNDKVLVTLEYYSNVTRITKKLIEEVALQYAAFVGKELVLSNH